MLRTMPYRLGPDGRPSHAGEDAAMLGQRLRDCRDNRFKDSPLFQVLDGIKPLEVPSDRTDIFRQQVADAQVKQQDLAKARDAAKSDKQAGQAAVAAIRQSLGLLDAVEPGVLIDLLLSYRAVGDWQGMINLANDMPEPLRDGHGPGTAGFRAEPRRPQRGG
jgi:MAP3K TRAFs-binding domain